MINAIASVFGAIIRVIYDLAGQNYGIAILLFTVLTKLILFPLNLKQTKSMNEMQKVAPLEKQIKEKYKDNKEKQAEELSKMYGEHKINPAGGCLPLLIQLPIIIAMFYIVKQPLTYIIQTPKDQIVEYTQELLNKQEVSDAEVKANEIIIARNKNIIDMNFMGLNLGDTPKDAFASNKDNNGIYDETSIYEEGTKVSIYTEGALQQHKKVSYVTLSIPILTILLAWLQTYITKKTSTLTKEQLEQQKSMNLMMPILSAYISYIMPLALGIYWLFGSVLGIVSQLIITKMVDNNSKKEDTKNYLGEGK